MAGSPFAEISMGFGNIAGGLLILLYANRMQNRFSLGSMFFITMSSIALAFLLMTVAGLPPAGMYIAISSFIMQISYAFALALAFDERLGTRWSAFSAYLLVICIMYLSRSCNVAFIIASTEDTTPYKIAVAASIVLVASSLLIYLRKGPALAETVNPDNQFLFPNTYGETVIKPELVYDDTSAQTTEEHSDISESKATPFRSAIDSLVDTYILTPQEGKVLAMLAQGRNAKSIAETMTLSSNTVRSHMRNIYAKLDVHSQQELIDTVNKHVDAIRSSGL